MNQLVDKLVGDGCPAEVRAIWFSRNRRRINGVTFARASLELRHFVVPQESETIVASGVKTDRARRAKTGSDVSPPLTSRSFFSFLLCYFSLLSPLSPLPSLER